MIGNIIVLVCLLLVLIASCVCVDITYHVEEENSPATLVGDIAADSHLLDTVPSQDHSLITFTQLQRRGSGSSQLFNVTKTGKLYTAQTLDAESLCTYNIECFKIVKVAVHKIGIFLRMLKIKVIIEDSNDHQPEFPVKQVNLQFSEGDAMGMTKSIPNAFDEDVGVLNSQITYQLKKNKDVSFSLSVSKTFDGISIPEIYLERRLDREVKDTYMLEIIAKDGGSPPKEAILNVQISVTDVNDNRPIFSQNIYNVSIRNTHQRSSPIVVISATDVDSGRNGELSYDFNRKTANIARRYFKLNQATGHIFLDDSFSLDKKQIYKLYIEVKDGGSPPLSSVAVVLVNVINNQNNVPNIDVDFVSAFTKDTTAISENSKVGNLIAHVMVTDNDIGQNGKVSCDIHHDTFQLSSMGSKEYKIIQKNSIDRETKDHYDITIRCQDKGFPPLQSERKISIQVTDVNDVRPQFTKDTFNFVTYENQKPNFPIGFINATDPDLGPGGQLTYSLITDNNKDTLLFKVTDYGFISTKQSLDRELKDIYKFKIIVKDNGTPSLNNTANVVVEILDKNDNAPYFIFPSVNPFSLDVHYHPQSKYDITVLKASDKDNQENAFLRYEVFKGNVQQLFKVNSHTGMLSFSRKVYQNDAGPYDLGIAVKDSGTPVLSATTTLSLTLTVSNKTMLKAVDIQSNNMIDIPLLIIIVVAAVIVSMAIVVSITLCILKCINGRNSSDTAGKDPPFQCRNEMGQLLYQTNNPVAMTRNPEEILNRNTRLIRSTSQFYPEDEELEKEWKFSTTPRRPPPGTQVYNQHIAESSCGQEDKNTVMAPNYLSDTLSTQRDSGHGWSEGDTKHYEEIPGMPGLNNSKLNISPTSEKAPFQDTYLAPIEQTASHCCHTDVSDTQCCNNHITV